MNILKLPRVIEKTGLSRSSVYDLKKRGLFPEAVKLSARAIGWREGDIEDWLNNRPKAAQ
ncbi:MAG: AlpA family transcriptional regulator [Methylobacter sp.]|jgi:prophage regulatory protein|uniref:helix-turn-helix transcriptional regulator n=1 Tax=Methylobacter sp. TaxID=2051955 RepID=UPI0025EBC891|nr:AlpA family phage regulatory protein [Methylobacter sp.]MCK9619233.1 AlpA family transcriptional regulator [Methylobacter sp.]